MLTNIQRKRRRLSRVRHALKTRNNGLPRLSVFLSNQNVYAQIIDDAKGVTLASASTVDKELRSKDNSSANSDVAAKIGKAIAERAKKAGVKKVVFDRGSKVFHGKVKALADGARENGLEF